MRSGSGASSACATAASVNSRPSDTRSAVPKYHPSPTARRAATRPSDAVAGVGERRPEVVVLPLELLHPSCHPGSRKPVRALSASVAKYSACAFRAAGSPPLCSSCASAYSRTVSSRS